VTRERLLLVIALGADLIGAAAVLLLVGRTWQRVTVSRHAPLPPAVVDLSGRDLQAALAAFALIALAATVAVAATRGIGRRLVGLALLGCGVLIAWRAALGVSPVGGRRARASVPTGVGIDASSLPRVAVDVAWPLLTVAGGLLVTLAGLLTVACATRWSSMAPRYEAPTAAARKDRSDGDIALWTALDRGEDPTTRTES
jgi:uncharacterized membrane protein (TIGR02234 family)